MKKIGIFYGSDGGNTEGICQKIAKALGEENTALFDVAKVKKEQILEFDNLILASSTYGSGDIQDDWDGMLSALLDSDFASKVVALVGVGDQDTYSDTFCDSLYHLYEKVKQAKLIGETEPDGYDFSDSRAIVDGKFVGLALDEDNQDDLTDSRIEAWVKVIKPLFS